MKSLMSTFALAMLLVLGAGCGSGGNETKPADNPTDATSNKDQNPTGETKEANASEAPVKITKADGSPVVVGFSQIGSESGWRTANSQSMKDEAEKRGNRPSL